MVLLFTNLCQITKRFSYLSHLLKTLLRPICPGTNLLTTKRLVLVGTLLVIAFFEPVEKVPQTRREALTLVSSVYDLIGLIAPFTQLGKFFFAGVAQRQLVMGYRTASFNSQCMENVG